jgi:16S rRNA G966 N2-methylase RsmD
MATKAFFILDKNHKLTNQIQFAQTTLNDSQSKVMNNQAVKHYHNTKMTSYRIPCIVEPPYSSHHWGKLFWPLYRGGL